MIKSENFICVQGWMVSELGLTGNELLCYALIYGFSQDEQSVFSGSSRYIAEWLGSTQQTVFNTLNRLVAKGLIIKIEKIVNGVKLCDYKILEGIKNFEGGTQKFLVGGTQKFLDHNIDKDNKKENMECNNTANLSFGECGNVRLTKEQYEKLKSKPNFDLAVEKLDTWLGTSGGKYRNKNHFAYFKSNSWVWENLTSKNTQYGDGLDELFL